MRGNFNKVIDKGSALLLRKMEICIVEIFIWMLQRGKENIKVLKAIIWELGKIIKDMVMVFRRKKTVMSIEAFGKMINFMVKAFIKKITAKLQKVFGKTVCISMIEKKYFLIKITSHLEQIQHVLVLFSTRNLNKIFLLINN